MRLIIRHETRYAYTAPAQHVIQSLRLKPRSHEGQAVRRWHLDIGADARLQGREDGHGNLVHTVFVDGPLDHLLIVAEGEVDTEDCHGTVAGAIERQPPKLYLRQTALTTLDPALAALADGVVRRQGGDRLAALHDLMSTLHAEMTFMPGATTAATTAAEAYAHRIGVCQDFAHVFLAAARRMGVPARYVAGHYLRTDVVEQDAGHAWVEAHLPGLGWIGFDPANAVCVTDRHVRVSIGCDGAEAAPVRGARLGGGAETLAVAVRVVERHPTVVVSGGIAVPPHAG
jgi:transglutaminase-like putative cysteine protease